MAFLKASGVALHYRIGGRAGKPRIAFTNSLGSDMRIWGAVEQILRDDFEMLFFDQRGHGLSQNLVGPYTLDDLSGDLLALLEALGWDRAALCGVSVGGLIAMDAALKDAARFSHLMLFDTAPRIGNTDLWAARIATVEADGLAAHADSFLARWFPTSFAKGQPEAWQGWKRMLEVTPMEGYIATCAALRDADLTASIHQLDLPVMLLAGTEDVSTPPSLVRQAADRIAGSRFATILGAGHLPMIDAGEEVASEIRRFVAG